MTSRSPFHMFIRPVLAALPIAVGATLAVPNGASAVEDGFAFAFLAGNGSPIDASAVLAADPNPPLPASAPAVQTFQDVDLRGLWLVDEGVNSPRGHFVCMAEYDDALPPCVRNADGTWDCWGELGDLSWRVGLCAASVGIPAWRAWRAADKAYEAFMAARAAKKAKDATRLATEAASGAAVSVAMSALAAVLGDFLCLDIKDSLDALWDCIQA